MTSASNINFQFPENSYFALLPPEVRGIIFGRFMTPIPPGGYTVQFPNDSYFSIIPESVREKIFREVMLYARDSDVTNWSQSKTLNEYKIRVRDIFRSAEYLNVIERENKAAHKKALEAVASLPKSTRTPTAHDDLEMRMQSEMLWDLHNQP